MCFWHCSRKSLCAFGIVLEREFENVCVCVFFFTFCSNFYFLIPINYKEENNQKKMKLINKIEVISKKENDKK